MFGMLEAMLSFLRRQVGLRTDSADENGSLHAKIKDVKTYLGGGVGTSTDDRADNTVMGWLNTSIKSWQNVTFTPTTATGNVAISSVNPAKCIVLFHGSGYGVYYHSDNWIAYSIHCRLVALTATVLSYACLGIGTSGQYGTHSATIIEFY